MTNNEDELFRELYFLKLQVRDMDIAFKSISRHVEYLNDIIYKRDEVIKDLREKLANFEVYVNCGKKLKANEERKERIRKNFEDNTDVAKK